MTLFQCPSCGWTGPEPKHKWHDSRLNGVNYHKVVLACKECDGPVKELKDLK